MSKPWVGVDLHALAVSQTEIAWAAGFFDGEGSIFINHQNAHRYDNTRGSRDYKINSPVMSVTQVLASPLFRFAGIVRGRIPTGPYKPKTARSNPYYRWDACGRPSVHRILSLLWPYLSNPKKQQALVVWDELKKLQKPKSPPLPPLPTDPIGCDLDGTLAEYPHSFPGIGPPIARMVRRVKFWLEEGKTVKIVTARVACTGMSSEYGTDDEEWRLSQVAIIEAWCEEHIGQKLPVTAVKDFYMICLWDDRAIQVHTNTGIRADGVDD